MILRRKRTTTWNLYFFKKNFYRYTLKRKLNFNISKISKILFNLDIYKYFYKMSYSLNNLNNFKWDF
jgi:hypothetical protein